MPSACASGSRSSPDRRSRSKARSTRRAARLRPIVHLRTRARDGPWRAAFPPNRAARQGDWTFELPPTGPEPLLKALIDGGAGIETLSIERPGLHDAFVAIAGEAAAREMVVAPGEAA